jgi:hypothetical protein
LSDALDKGFAGKLCCVRGRGVGVHPALEDMLHGNVNLTPKAMRIEGEKTVFDDENGVGVHLAPEDVLHGTVNVTSKAMQIEGEIPVLASTSRWRTCRTAPSTSHPS